LIQAHSSVSRIFYVFLIYSISCVNYQMATVKHTIQKGYVILIEFFQDFNSKPFIHALICVAA